MDLRDLYFFFLIFRRSPYKTNAHFSLLILLCTSSAVIRTVLLCCQDGELYDILNLPVTQGYPIIFEVIVSRIVCFGGINPQSHTLCLQVYIIELDQDIYEM